jgi:glycine/D-amino acid oxidase-like deaminating enzyme
MGNQKNWGNRPWEVDFRAGRRELPPRLDFAVVGGGFTGLAAAAWLKKLAPEKSVALFESESFGAGSSGHTGGLALAETAGGDLPGLGDVLAGYQKLLRGLQIDGELTLPGVYELGRTKPLKNSPMRWKDSGDLCAVKQVAGGTINPGKVVSGLARAAEGAGAMLFEHAAVEEVKFADKVELHSSAGVAQVHRVLFATNAFALELTGLQGRAQAAFTTAVVTETFSADTIEQIGLSEGKPFYTVDMPYLWGRLLGDAVIFGSGLFFPGDWRRLTRSTLTKANQSRFLPA